MVAEYFISSLVTTGPRIRSLKPALIFLTSKRTHRLTAKLRSDANVPRSEKVISEVVRIVLTFAGEHHHTRVMDWPDLLPTQKHLERP